MDLAAIAVRSRLFIPAGIEFAAGRTAQLVSGRVMFEHGEDLTPAEDVLRAVAQTRRILAEQMRQPPGRAAFHAA